MSLDARIVVTARGVDAHIEVPSVRTVALVGPNGSGKSTVVEALAGIVATDGGHVSVDDAARTRTPHSRTPRVGIVPQDGALFAHMSVLDNVAFGLRAQGVRRAAARRTAQEVLARVDAADLAQRRPAQLSGGQARRVAIARAVATEPDVLLFDEPFAGLDTEVATQIRGLLASLRGSATIVLTTHDAVDAFLLADAVAVLDAGHVVESGVPEQVFLTPRTAFTAAMAGRVLMTGVMDGGQVLTPAGERIPVAAGPADGTAAAVAIRPADIAIRPADIAAQPHISERTGERSGERASARTGKQTGEHTGVRETTPGAYLWLERTVSAIEPRADAVRVFGGALCADVDPSLAPNLAVGTPVVFGVPHGQEAYAI